MASKPQNAPVCTFLSVPMRDAVELDLEKAECSQSLDSAKQKANDMLKANEETRVVIFQAVNMMGIVKKTDVLWSPSGSN